MKGFEGVSNPFGELLNIEVVKADPEGCIYRLKVRPEHKNPNGVVHGAVLYALADDSMGAAIYMRRKSSNHATINIFMEYMGSIKEGEIICETKIFTMKKTVAFLEAVIHDGNGKILAKAFGTFRLF